jgi:PEP-CTERM motif
MKYVVLLASALVLCVPSQAEQLSFDYGASVNLIYRYDYANRTISTPGEITVGGTTISWGDTLKGTFGYDAATPMTAVPESWFPTYVGSGALVVSTLKFDAKDVSFHSTPNARPDNISVWYNDQFGGDHFVLEDMEGSGAQIHSTQFEFVSMGDAGVYGPTLPTSLTNFTGKVVMSVDDPTNAAVHYSIFATMTSLVPSVSAVPEPATYAMFLAGLGLLGWRRRGQSQAHATA